MKIVGLFRVGAAFLLMPTVAASAHDGHDRNSHRAVQTEHHDAAPSAIPEPSDIALFAAGVAGLIIGRRSSRSRRRDD